MKGDRLKADEVVAAGNARRDRGRPRAVLLNHDTVTPHTAVDGAVDKTRLVDLEPLECGRVNPRAGTAWAFREVRELDGCSVGDLRGKDRRVCTMGPMACGQTWFQ